MTTHADFIRDGRMPLALTLTVRTTRTAPDVPGAVETSTVDMLAVPVRHVAAYASAFIVMAAAALAAVLTR